MLMPLPLWLRRPFAFGTPLAALVALAAVMAMMVISAVALFGAPRSPALEPQRPATRPSPTGPSAPAAGDATLGPVAEGAAALDQRFAAARAQHDLGDPAEAFTALATLADEGHCDAARLALQMIHAGPEAYLMSFRAGPKQVSHWRRLPNCWPQPVRR